MRNIILYIAASLDNFISREDGSVDWLFVNEGYGYKEFYQSIDTVIMGFNTYEKILSFGPYEYKDKKSIVLTTKKIDPPPGVQFVNDNFLQVATEAKSSPGRNIWLCGGGKVNTLFLKHRLIDEIWLFIQPIILGKGIPLFYDAGQTSFTVKELKGYQSGMTKLVLIPQYI